MGSKSRLASSSLEPKAYQFFYSSLADRAASGRRAPEEREC
jgi:hypothetical protein